MSKKTRIKRPVSFKMDAGLHDRVTALLESDRIKYGSFTRITEMALVQFLISHPILHQEK